MPTTRIRVRSGPVELRGPTGWRTGNRASQRVSEKLGYVTNGVQWTWDDLRRAEVEVVQAYVTPERFAAGWSAPVTVDGVDDAVRVWLGVVA